MELGVSGYKLGEKERDVHIGDVKNVQKYLLLMHIFLRPPMCHPNVQNYM